MLATAPLSSDILNVTLDPLSTKTYNTRAQGKRFRYMLDKTRVTVQGHSNDAYIVKGFKKMNTLVSWSNNLGLNIVKNGIYLMAMSDQACAINNIQLEGYVRVFYTDA